MLRSVGSRRVSPGELAEEIARRSESKRLLVAIAGPPGAGKSTISEILVTTLNDTYAVATQIAPMDGFHYDNSVLRALGRQSRKGAPHTFDVDGLLSTAQRLRENAGAVAVPVFDRDNDLARAGARLISADTRIVLIEGNYLLLEDPPWRDLRKCFDLSVMIDCDETLLEKRLLKRWLDQGFPADQARARRDSNDMLNARTVITGSRSADFSLVSGT